MERGGVSCKHASGTKRCIPQSYSTGFSDGEIPMSRFSCSSSAQVANWFYQCSSGKAGRIAIVAPSAMCIDLVAVNLGLRDASTADWSDTQRSNYLIKVPLQAPC